MTRPPRRSGARGDNPYSQADAWTLKAKAEGYPARSVYKLIEIDRRCQLFRPGFRVLDLGCAPGSWLLYAARAVGPTGLVIGVDITPIAISIPRNARALAGDAFAAEGEMIEVMRAEGPFDVVVSDMAPSTTGTRSSDQARSAELVIRSLEIARSHLKVGGKWVAKIFMSDAMPEVRRMVRGLFASERTIRPEGTRSISYETFLIGEKRLPCTFP